MWSQGTGERGLGSGEDSRGGGFGRFWQDLTVAGGCRGRRGSVGSRAGEGGERRAARSPASPPARPASERAAARSEFGIAGGPTQGYPAFLVVFPRPPLPPLPPAQSSETPRPRLVYSGGGRPLGPGAAAGPGGRERARGIRGGPQVRAAPVAGLRLPGAKGRGAGAAAPRLLPGTGAPCSVGFPRKGQILRLGFPAFAPAVYTPRGVIYRQE